jgi:hypothetical protein
MNNKSPNYFVRTLIVFLCLGIGTLIAYNFFYSPPLADISPGLLILLAFLLVLVLAESFDNFSIGKLISINKDVKEKEKENIVLERKNSELINQLISITNIQTQTQSHTSVFGDYYIDKKKGSQSKEIDENQVQKLLDVVENTPLIIELVDAIKIDLDEKGLPYDSPTDEILIKHLAGTQLALEFEKIHTLIFGSQITLLKELNSIKPQGETKEEINSYVSNVYNQFPNSFKDWSSNKYLSFLYTSFLITNSEEDTIHITVRGVEYLSWIIRNGKREDNPL